MRSGTKILFYIGSFVSCFMMSMTTGCASGGYKITRGYARWVNSQNIVIRIIIYIFTSFVFAITLLIDAVIFNTIDFWQGTVSGGKFEFKDGEKTYYVNHEFAPGTQLKRSTIEVKDKEQKLLQTIVLSEIPTGQIEMRVDGKLRTRARDITTIPMVTLFDEGGRIVDETALIFSIPDTSKQYIAFRN